MFVSSCVHVVPFAVRILASSFGMESFAVVIGECSEIPNTAMAAKHDKCVANLSCGSPYKNSSMELAVI